jgi:hypothetical protein
MHGLKASLMHVHLQLNVACVQSTNDERAACQRCAGDRCKDTPPQGDSQAEDNTYSDVLRVSALFINSPQLRCIMHVCRSRDAVASTCILFIGTLPRAVVGSRVSYFVCPTETTQTRAAACIDIRRELQFSVRVVFVY